MVSLAPPSKVNFITEPGYDYGYLAWSKDWDSTTVYTVEVLQKNEDSNGGHFFRSVFNQEVRKNFLRLDKQFTTGSDLFYTVNAYDQSRNLIATSDTVFANPNAMECDNCGPTLYRTCKWGCNGKTYAFDLVLYTNQPLGNNGSLQPTQAMTYVNGDAQIGIPYYEAMTDDVFHWRNENGTEVWDFPYLGDNRDYNFATNVNPSDGVADHDGGILVGNVYFVEKMMDAFVVQNNIDYSILYSTLGGLSTDYSGQFAESSCSVWTDSFAELLYNDTANHQTISLPDIVGDTIPMQLECLPDHGFNIPDGIEVEYPLFDIVIQCDADIDITANELNLNQVLDGLECEGFLWIEIGATGNDNGGPVVSNIVADNVSEKGDPPFEIDVSHVFDTGEPYTAPDYDLESGLYRLTFIYEDGYNLPVYLEYDAENADPISNSDFADLTIAPNPITTDQLDFKVEVERRMKFQVKVLALDGTELHSEYRDLQADTELKRSIKVPEADYPYQQLVVKLLFEDGSSVEEIALRPRH